MSCLVFCSYFSGRQLKEEDKCFVHSLQNPWPLNWRSIAVGLETTWVLSSNELYLLLVLMTGVKWNINNLLFKNYNNSTLWRNSEMYLLMSLECRLKECIHIYSSKEHVLISRSVIVGGFNRDHLWNPPHFRGQKIHSAFQQATLPQPPIWETIGTWQGGWALWS